jgi:menaquinol-cytochrome c reductase iron-sulfur subunit
MNNDPIENPTDEKRRRFLVKLSLGVSFLTAAAAGIPVLSALLAPLLEKTPNFWRKVGDLESFPIGTTNLVTFENADAHNWSSITSRSAAWLRRDDEKTFSAFSANCTHLGCPVRWEGDAQLFMCPCHGGVYYKDGSVAAGPPPKALVQYPVRVKNKAIEIRTSPIPITNISA